MNEYVQQAKDFLEKCDASIDFTYLGKKVNPNWNDNQIRNTYGVTIFTPLGNMTLKYWDSVVSTRNGSQPTEYDILACLQKYDVGSFEDFVSEYGYEIEEFAERQRVKNIWYATCKEYERVCKCFTEEQIKEMREIW